LNYPHSHLWINGRQVSFKDIAEDKARVYTSFEENTFAFVRAWLTEQPKFTLTTSGSTGPPKLITINRAQMIASAQLTHEALELRSTYNALICLDTKYIAGKMMVVRSFVSGMYMVALDPCSNPLCKIPMDMNVHFAAMVPYQIQMVLESKHPHLLNNLLTVLIGGSALDNKFNQQLQSFTCECFATYGMTETLTHIALQKLNGERQSDYFKTLPGVVIQTDERGCLVIEAPHLTDKIVTNDLVKIISKDEFKWLGRWDNVINTGGVKILPEALEEKISKIITGLNFSIRFFIHGIPDPTWGNKIVLLIEDGQPRNDNYNKLSSELIQTLPAAERPKEIWITPSFSYTETGKINRLKSLENVSLNITIKN
jgi:o-succinylbenzoate---CoA ligase